MTTSKSSGRFRSAVSIVFLVALITLLRGLVEVSSDRLEVSANGWILLVFSALMLFLGALGWQGNRVGLQAAVVLYAIDTVMFVYTTENPLPSLLFRVLILAALAQGLFSRRQKLLPVSNPAPSPSLKDVQQWFERRRSESTSMAESRSRVLPAEAAATRDDQSGNELSERKSQGLEISTPQGCDSPAYQGTSSDSDPPTHLATDLMSHSGESE